METTNICKVNITIKSPILKFFDVILVIVINH